MHRQTFCERIFCQDVYLIGRTVSEGDVGGESSLRVEILGHFVAGARKWPAVNSIPNTGREPVGGDVCLECDECNA